MDSRDQVRRLPHRGAARSRQGAFADAKAAGLDASVPAHRQAVAALAGGNGAARRRIGRRERKRHFQFFAAANRLERRPRGSIRLLDFRSVASGRPGFHQRAAEGAQGGAAPTFERAAPKRSAPLYGRLRGTRIGDFQACMRAWGSRASFRNCATRLTAPGGRKISSKPNVTMRRNSWWWDLRHRPPCRTRSVR